MNLGEQDRWILKEALEKGTPCVPFILVNALGQSLSILKRQAMKGFFVARIPTLFRDGSMIYLYKEECALNTVTNLGWLQAMKSQGRTYFFLGLHQQVDEPQPNDKPYLDPRIFSQNKSKLLDVEFHEEIQFFRQSHAPLLEVAFIPIEDNPRARCLGIVNFSLVSRIYPLEEREDPSGIFQFYEEWRSMGYPTSGKELVDLLDSHVQHMKSQL